MIKFGLIGHPIEHSASPALFAKAYGGRWQYDLIEGEDFEASWQRFLDEYQAINITAPFKEAAFRKVTECGVIGRMPDRVGHDGSVIAGHDGGVIEELRAINIAVKEADGKIHGYNSDYLGVLKVLKDRGFGSGQTAGVAGFGGAGRAAAAAARVAGMDVVVCNRTRYTPDIRPLDELPVLAGVADLLIYTLAVPVPVMPDLLSVMPDQIGHPQAILPDQQHVMPDPIGHPLAILEANYRNPCLAGRPGYIPGTEWHRAQAETGYPLMTGCPISNI